ncbi:hypothetical protein SAY87_001156 [Trapa incisa]|uniref:Uncharacterized protein n=1 Tax=Trapa incisa TaxID=236973 RepID=A0AAN7JHF4_9MYRT|nr:hypothetical protein SAY87_001156 [Trapa incisa]
MAWSSGPTRNAPGGSRSRGSTSRHQDLAPPVVRPEAGEALLGQGVHHYPLLQATRRHPRGLLPRRQGRRGRPQQAVRL